MFTGIIEELGRIASLEMLEQGMRLNIACSTVLDDTKDGNSIAVNGVCLTALNVSAGSFSADLSPENIGTYEELAVDEIVGKPFDFEELRDIIAGLEDEIEF